jgi:circadian clock protein KaiC
MGLHFIYEGLRQGQGGLYIGFQENPIQLKSTMESFGWNTEELPDLGFEVMYRSPVEMQIDTITNEVFKRIMSGKIKRVVVDALGDLERSSIDRQRFSDFVYALTQWFAVQNVTCVMLYELSRLFVIEGISDQEVSNMSDNVILLRFTDDVEMHRTIRIIKTRGSAHDARERRLKISSDGLVIERA